MAKEELISKAMDKLPKTVSAIDNVLSTLVGALDVFLTPVQLFKEYKDYKVAEFKENLAIKAKKIPQEDLKDSLDLKVVGPTLDALKYTIFDDDLRSMFENLLVSSINKKKDIFPSFVEIIRELSSDEAKLLKYLAGHGKDYPLIDVNLNFANNKGYRQIIRNFTDIGFGVCEKPDLVPTYLINLQRFGLIDIPYGTHLVDNNLYLSLENNPFIVDTMKEDVSSFGKFEIRKSKFTITDFGLAFINSCVIES